MKGIIKPIFNIFRCLLALLIFLFSIATLMGHSYMQTFFLCLLVLTILYWPSALREKWNQRISNIIRLSSIVVLFLVSFLVFKPEPKNSIYLSDQMEAELMEIYDQKVTHWPEGTEDIYIETQYGKVHLLACGDLQNPPLVMIHAASMGAHSWAENLAPLLNHYRIYSIDNIGEGNKSQLNNALEYPETQKEIADHVASIMDALGVESSPLFGASNGGFVAMCYTYYYPARVESLSLFGPMGLTQLSGKSIMMLSIASMYPFPFIREKVRIWALGNDQNVNGKYGDWFSCILKGTIPSLGMPVPLNTEQKARMDLPVLLFLGTEDHIVGDAEIARKTAEEYPDIRIEVLKSGHLVAVEHEEFVNTVVSEFLDLTDN